MLTLTDRVSRHLTAALVTIATAVENRERRLADFDAFWRSPDRVAASRMMPGPNFSMSSGRRSTPSSSIPDA